jgi:multiple sugar transport system permease protein
MEGSNSAIEDRLLRGGSSVVALSPVRPSLPTAGRRKTRGAGPVSLKRLLLPMLIFLLAMVGLPTVYAIWLSFTNFHFGSQPVFNGLQNYRQMMVDPLFWSGLRITFVLYFLSLALQIIFGVWLGLMLNRITFMQKLVRTILLSPFVMPPVVVAMMWIIILDPSLGVANYILQSLGLPQSGWLSSPGLVVPLFAALDTWQAAPLVALLILGGLQTLPKTVYEAASLDGASGLAMFRYITIPLLAPTLVTVAVLRSIDLLRFFDLIYIITQGGPGNASTTLNIYSFRLGFQFFDMGYASALMIALSIVIFAVVACLVRLRRICEW